MFMDGFMDNRGQGQGPAAGVDRLCAVVCDPGAPVLRRADLYRVTEVPLSEKRTRHMTTPGRQRRASVSENLPVSRQLWRGPYMPAPFSRSPTAAAYALAQGKPPPEGRGPRISRPAPPVRRGTPALNARYRSRPSRAASVNRNESPGTYARGVADAGYSVRRRCGWRGRPCASRFP